MWRCARLRLVAAALGFLFSSPILAEIPEPYPKYELRPVEEAHPEFARQEPPSFTVSVTVDAPLSKAWGIMKQQGILINSLTACKRIFNYTGEPGDWLMVVQWHTPVKWHRWTRTDVRKYVKVDEDTHTVAFFLVGGFGLWMPKLAFREELKPGPTEYTSILTVGVWYELDDKYIGWPTHNLKRLTRERWTEFYQQRTWGYGAELANLAMGRMAPVPAIGLGRIQDGKVAAGHLKSEL